MGVLQAPSGNPNKYFRVVMAVVMAVNDAQASDHRCTCQALGPFLIC